MKKIILVVLALIVAACSTSSEYDQKLKQWTDAGVSHYRYDLVIGCFCPFSQDMPLTIEVKDGQIVSITNVEGVLLDASNPSYQYYLEYATIDLLFAELKSEMAEAEELTVAYDPQYGFPSEVWIDRIKLAVDDEMSLQVTNFEVLE